MINFKMVHTADLGLKDLPHGGINPKTGLNRRFEDILHNFKYIISEAIREKVKYFIIAGDVNEERNPESILIEKFSGCIADLISQDIKVIIVAGNHDVDSSKGTSTSVSYIKSLGLINTFVADKEIETFEFDDVVFHCVPTMYPSKFGMTDYNELTEYINKEINKLKTADDRPTILISHYSTEDAFPEYFEVAEAVLKHKTLERFDYVALGHIHKYKMYKEFTGGYSGSLFVKDFGEEKEKFINIVEFNEKKNGAQIKKISVPERAFLEYEFTMEDEDADALYHNIESQLKSTALEGSIIKLKITSRRRVDPKPIYDFLRKGKIFHFTPIQWIIEKDTEIKTIQMEDGKSDNDIISEFMKTEKLSKPQTKAVTEYTSKIIQDYNESY